MFSKVVTIETKFINNIKLLFGFKYGIKSGVRKNIVLKRSERTLCSTCVMISQ